METEFILNLSKDFIFQFLYDEDNNQVEMFINGDKVSKMAVKDFNKLFVGLGTFKGYMSNKGWLKYLVENGDLYSIYAERIRFGLQDEKSWNDFLDKNKIKLNLKQ